MGGLSVQVLLRAAALAVAGARGDIAVARPPVFEIDLDLAPERRFVEVIGRYRDGIRAVYEHLFDKVGIRQVLSLIARRRGKEEPELQKEIDAVAEITGIPAEKAQVMQMLYELQTLMVPFENITFPWSGPGCTGILALNKADGMVYHARNQDFSPASLLQGLVYTGVFRRGGRELFRAQMIAGYSMPITALRPGPNGYSFEGNTRYPDHFAGDEELLTNLFSERRPLNLWTVRKVLEEVPDYEDAVARLSTSTYAAPMYHVVGGVRKGVILASNPDREAYRMTLGEQNFQCRQDYIIITNFDYVFHDVREWFDFTGGRGIGHPRRLVAQQLLNGTGDLTPQVLLDVLNDSGVLAIDTIFQVLINVETGTWNASLPRCRDCVQTRSLEQEQLVVV